MKKHIKLLALPAFLFTLLFSGCFDIEEEYWFNKDGSGSAEYRVDLSQVMDMMEMMKDMMPDSLNENNDKFDLKDSTTVMKLRSIPGISNVKNLNDVENNIMSYSFDFANIQALNNSMNHVSGDLQMGEETESEETFEWFSWSKGNFSRKEKARPDTPEDLEMAKSMLQDGSYAVKYHFEQKVKKSSNNAYEKGEDGKSISLKMSLLEMVTNEKHVATNVKIK